MNLQSELGPAAASRSLALSAACAPQPEPARAGRLSSSRARESAVSQPTPSLVESIAAASQSVGQLRRAAPRWPAPSRAEPSRAAQAGRRSQLCRLAARRALRSVCCVLCAPQAVSCEPADGRLAALARAAHKPVEAAPPPEPLHMLPAAPQPPNGTSKPTQDTARAAKKVGALVCRRQIDSPSDSLGQVRVAPLCCPAARVSGSGRGPRALRDNRISAALFRPRELYGVNWATPTTVRLFGARKSHGRVS